MAGLSPASIFSFPVELGQHILSFCHPWDVAAFSKTCRAAYILVYQPTDQYLWRQLYTNQFDVPKLTTLAIKEKVEWKNELTSRLKVELALFRGPATSMERKRALETLISIIEDSFTAASLTGSSRNIKWLKRITSKSLILSNLYSLPESDEDAELHARLRAYLALTIDSKHDKQTFQSFLSKRDKSRAYVYDLRNYTAENKWGPFKPCGATNWVHVEHLIDVVASNIRELPGSWALTRPPSCLDPPRSSSTHLLGGIPSNDWAGVEGTWRRYVCFMDYRQAIASRLFVLLVLIFLVLVLLVIYLFTDLAGGPRHPKFFKDPRFREATRLIEVKMHLIPSKEMRFHKLPEDSVERNVLFPPLCFTGSSKGVNGNEAAVEGFVTMGKDGIPRWRMTSIYDNHPQWSSTGVQIGGVKSAMGVIGIWTTTHHDEDDPVGPFWLWKVEDNSPTHLMEFN
ncbi:hypothetical protein BDZ97DRAFT_1751578 [Flammula alnicola]|nr:hypothetical protein BDZ97DRAFT_1751578 [Flammula alnicola]